MCGKYCGLFSELEAKPVESVRLSGHTDLDLSFLLDLRHRAGTNHRIKTKNIENRYPERFRSILSGIDSTDDLYKFWKRVDQEQFFQPIIRQHVDGVEFVDRTILSVQKWEQLVRAKQDVVRERERVKRYNRRVVDSEVKKAAAGPCLGNIGNNLEKVAKPVRDRRYKIQRVIQKNGLSRSQYVCNCGCNIGDVVTLKKNQEFGNCNFSGVATCGSVWACPVCRAKIINKREQQLETIYHEGIKKGYYFSFLTLTFSHKKHDNLAKMHGSSNDRVGLSGAITKLRESYFWTEKFKKSIGYVGDIRAVEITWGEKNGFHPHVHLVILSRERQDVEALESAIYPHWEKYCESSGLGTPNRENGVVWDHVENVEQVKYLAKWAAPQELAREDQKEAKKQNFNIAQLERGLVESDYRDSAGLTMGTCISVLKAYYAGMEGQKMLTYGNPAGKWKQELLGEDVTDEELTSEEMQAIEEAQLVYIHSDVYKMARKRGLLNEIVERVEAIPDGAMTKIKACAVVQQVLKKNNVQFLGNVRSGGNFIPREWYDPEDVPIQN